MPALIHPTGSRRSFLGATILSSAALVIKCQSLKAATNDTYRTALLSDTHIPANPADGFRGFDPRENLKTVATQISQTSPDAMVINGDAARLTGEIRDYETLKKLIDPLTSKFPAYVGLGNHDHRENFYSVMNDSSPLSDRVAEKHVMVVENPLVRMVVLDSLLYVDKVAGLLGLAQRQWLEKFLKESDDRPTVFFVHHTLGEGDGDLLDADRFFRIIEPHQKVKAVFYGHSHRYHFSKREHIHLINLPAVGYNFSDDQPVGWLDGVFSASGVRLTLHAIAGNRSDNGKTTSLTWA